MANNTLHTTLLLFTGTNKACWIGVYWWFGPVSIFPGYFYGLLFIRGSVIDLWYSVIDAQPDLFIARLRNLYNNSYEERLGWRNLNDGLFTSSLKKRKKSSPTICITLHLPWVYMKSPNELVQKVSMLCRHHDLMSVYEFHLNWLKGIVRDWNVLTLQKRIAYCF